MKRWISNWFQHIKEKQQAFESDEVDYFCHLNHFA